MIIINKCESGHYFLSNECPFCGKTKIGGVEYREGDCIKCGNLCPGNAYGCNEKDLFNSRVT